MKKIISKVPFIGPFLQNIYRNMKAPKFTSSEQYWEKRYQKGGNSGSGSYNHLAHFKAEIINDFVSKNSIKIVCELGSGDGNQLLLTKYPHYIGYDISPTIIEKAKSKFSDDPTKEFKHLKLIENNISDLSLSLDVIYHLVEDHIFEDYMHKLFNSSKEYVIIYSSNQDQYIGEKSKHVKHRNFTKWVESNLKNWELLKTIPNKYPYNGDYKESSFADFFIYKKIN